MEAASPSIWGRRTKWVESRYDPLSAANNYLDCLRRDSKG
jgi:hypothetical protein